MKKILTITILVVSFQLFSQTSSTSGKIIYEKIIDFNDGEEAKSIDYVLHFNQNESYCEEVIKSKFKKSKEVKEDGTIMLEIRDNQNPQFYYYSLKEGFYFNEIRYNQELFVKDNLKINWVLSDKTKVISGFECQKATTKFRGRTYTAWFTSSIPLIFGPWKLNGLSGLILEVYESTGFFQMRVKKISIGDGKVEVPNMTKKIQKALTISEFKIRTEELRANFLSKLNSKLPKGLKPFTMDKDCEDCPKPLEIFDEEK